MTCHAFFKFQELKFLFGSAGSVDSSLVGFSGKGKARHTDGRVWGSPLTQQLERGAFDDVSMIVVDPNAVSHSPAAGTGACGQSFLNPNAGARSAEKTKTDKYKLRLLCQQLAAGGGGSHGLPVDRDFRFVPIIFTASCGMEEQFQRQHRNPHWSRVEAEDEAMHIGSATAAVGCQKEEGNLAGHWQPEIQVCTLWQWQSRSSNLKMHCQWQCSHDQLLAAYPSHCGLTSKFASES
jgi:hypothetical protein